MAIPVLICDDSSFARGQLARSLPPDWDVTLNYAADGAEALAALHAGRGDILFLDLNMPGMDGYHVLQAIREQGLPTLVVVVSGDVQPEARARVLSLGAIEFLRKPASPEQVADILERFGIHRSENRPEDLRRTAELDLADAYREIANVAQGRAADLLARLLKVFVQVTIPAVVPIEAGRLQAVLGQVAGREQVLAVSQGFVGGGLAGEAVLLFRESDTADMASLLGCVGPPPPNAALELVMDVAGVLIGASLKGVADQLGLGFSIGQPVVMGRHVTATDLLARPGGEAGSLLAVRMGYAIEGHSISCEVLVLFTQDSLPVLRERIGFFAGWAS